MLARRSCVVPNLVQTKRGRVAAPLLAIAIVAASLAPSSNAAAADNAAAAEALFVEGRNLLQQKRFDAACPKLAESQRLDPATGTLLALALCYEGQGKIASAWAAYAEVASRAAADKNTERERAAKERIADLGPKLPRLVLDLLPEDLPSGLSILRDGVEVGNPSLGTPIPVDPGDHEIVMKAPGKRAATFKATAKIGETTHVKLGPLADEPSVAVAPPPVASGSPSGFFTPMRVAGVVGGAAGVLGLGAAGVLSGLALSKKADSDKDCQGNVCGPTGLPLRKDARSLGDGASISVIVGGVLAAAGVTLVIVGGPSGAPPKTAASLSRPRVTLTPVGTLGGGGFSMEGTFQ